MLVGVFLWLDGCIVTRVIGISVFGFRSCFGIISVVGWCRRVAAIRWLDYALFGCVGDLESKIIVMWCSC